MSTGSFWNGGLNKSLKAATVVQLPGKGSQTRQLGDLFYGPMCFCTLCVCEDTIVSEYPPLFLWFGSPSIMRMHRGLDLGCQRAAVVLQRPVQSLTQTLWPEEGSL